MTKKLSRIGSSRGILLDKTILGLLGIGDEDEDISMRVEGRRLIIESARQDPFEELRAAFKGQDPEEMDKLINEAVKHARSETVRRRKASRGG